MNKQVENYVNFYQKFALYIDITRKINFLFLNGVPFDLETITC